MSPLSIEVDSWGRKELFKHYKDYDNPFFNLCVRVDIAGFYRMIKERQYPFSLSLLYLCLRVANNQKCFRYRIRNDEVVLLDQANAAMTILHEDDFFDFCYFQYMGNYFDFLSNASEELESHRIRRRNLRHVDNEEEVIHFTMLPWMHFTSMSHAFNSKIKSSMPKIIFGKFEAREKRIELPIAIEVNHALVDGLDVARYLQELQHYLNHPELIDHPSNVHKVPTAHAVGM